MASPSIEHTGGWNCGKIQERICVQRVRLRNAALAGQMSGLRQLEHADGAGAPRGVLRAGEEAQARPGKRRRGAAHRPDPGRRPRAPAQRHRRAGPGAGRRHRGGLAGAGGRRSGHRQVHAADPGLRQPLPRGHPRALRLRRGIRAADQDARQPPGGQLLRLLRALGKRSEHRGAAHGAALAAHHSGRFHSDDVPAGDGLRAGQRLPGA